MRAKYQQPAAKSSTKDFQPQMTLLLFEEPEAFLYPQQQELLARELRVLASNHTFQVICSTHSPTFVSRNSDKLTSIVRLRRDMGKVHKSQISQDQFSVITKGNIQKYTEIDEKFPQRDKFAKDHDDLDPQMEEIKYFMWLNPDRCSMFFARKVLIVEGYTEYALINRLIADGFIQDGIGVYILECNGKFKMHAYMSILAALEIEHAVIFDDDQDPANPVNSQRQNEINTLIKSVASDYTVKLQPISPDLETMLQIDMSAIKSDKQAHRKPQHTLYWYTQKRIDDELLKRFCAIVNDCIAATKS
jgi:predicted ATP-dependent endonuclease of OLD family